jgi:hypothetical protein
MLWELLAGLFSGGVSLTTGLFGASDNRRLAKKAEDIAERDRQDKLKAQKKAFGLEEQKLALAFGGAREAKKQNRFSRKQKIVDRGLQMLSFNSNLRDQMSDLWSSAGILGSKGGV